LQPKDQLLFIFRKLVESVKEGILEILAKLLILSNFPYEMTT